MKIVICGSIYFTEKIKEAAEVLEEKGHSVEIPLSCRKIIAGELSLEEFRKETEDGIAAERKIKYNVIKRHFEKIRDAEAILVLNYSKKGIDNYIGGNTFLEIGFAHVLDKKIFLLNDIPEISYSDEIKAMSPILLKGDVGNLE